MDHKPQRRHSVSVQSPTPSSLRHCLKSTSPGTTPQLQSGRPLRHSPKTKTKLNRPPQPAALARVKGTRTMETPSRSSTEMSWLNDPSSMSSSPRTIQTCRSRTPDASSNTSLVTPSSSLLQDLLNEQRATRGSRTTMSENPEDTEDTHTLKTPHTRSRSQSHSKSQTQTQSQDDASSERQRKAQIALSAGLKNPREMGMREMDHYISKINKQNFDLKLEIFHRAQQMILLEKKLERMMEMEEELHRMRGLEDELQELRDAEEDNLRLRESNEQLRQEIDKRDQAVTEAVTLICQLEARVEQLEAGGESQPSTPRAPIIDDGSEATTPRNAVFDIPERTSSRRGTGLPERYLTSASRHLKRAPSFLREESKNTAVLRSLYAPAPAAEQHGPGASEFTKSESYNSMNGTVEPESPRLSALSECSELHLSASTRNSLGFDEIDIPARKVSTTEQTDLSFDTESVRIDCWVQPRPDAYALDMPKRVRPTLDTLKAAEKTSFESGSLFNSSSQRTQVDSVFGSARLPPTPDTMSTAHAPGSNGSNTAEKSHLDELLAVKRSLRRPRSADELTTTRRSSGNSQVNASLDPNASEATIRRPSFEDTDEPPVLYPLNSLPYRSSPLPRHDLSHDPQDYSEGDIFLNGGGMDKVLSKMEQEYYSPRKHAADRTPSSPPLSPQEWVEAARTSSRPRKGQPHPPHKGPVPADTRLVGSRAPSQSSFLGRRHSIDSTISNVPNIPTLDLRSLEPMPQSEPEPDHDRPRKLSLKPFFTRSTGPRRQNQSPNIDSDDKDDGAPAPTIRKTRQLGNRPGRMNQGTETASPGGNVDFSASAPTYAEGRGEDVAYKTLPHSLTESNMPKGFSNPKDHKRRSSLGIFGWMKGGSKKADPDPYVLPIPPAPSRMRERSSRMAQDIPTTIPATIPETKEADMATMNIAVEDFALARRIALAEESPPRRPRYVDRRSRRG